MHNLISNLPPLPLLSFACALMSNLQSLSDTEILSKWFLFTHEAIPPQNMIMCVNQLAFGEGVEKWFCLSMTFCVYFLWCVTHFRFSSNMNRNDGFCSENMMMISMSVIWQNKLCRMENNNFVLLPNLFTIRPSKINFLFLVSWNFKIFYISCMHGEHCKHVFTLFKP